MPARMPARRSCYRLRIEAAIRAQSHQQTNRQIPKQLGQLHRIIPRIEDKNRYLAMMWAALKQRPNLLRCDVVDILGRFHTPRRERRTPTVMPKTDLSQPLIRPAGDDGLAGGMAIVVMIIAASGSSPLSL